jgi:hypothetical protein
MLELKVVIERAYLGLVVSELTLLNGLASLVCFRSICETVLRFVIASADAGGRACAFDVHCACLSLHCSDASRKVLSHRQRHLL